ncbi:SGNH/GDSL hydrolase family protein [Chloroflexota bacterium]
MTRQLFVLGDSISLGYGPTLAHYLDGALTYSRKTANDPAIMDLPDPQGRLRDENGTDSEAVLGFLQAKLATEDFKPDVLLLNCGLHDLRTMPDSGEKQVAPNAYRANLASICRAVASVIPWVVWVRTTPVDDARHNSQQQDFYRYQADVEQYNAIADAVMQAAGIPIIDLHGFTQKLGVTQYIDHVHFGEQAQNLQAAYIAGHLTALLTP